MNTNKNRIFLTLTLALAASAASVQAQSSQEQTSQQQPSGTAMEPAARAPGVPDPAPVHPELAGVFDDFGGKPGMDALMEDFMAIMLENPRLRPFFENVDQGRVKAQLSDQFCAILGGGCVYKGRDMTESHAGFDIRRADFNALVEDLQTAMNRRDIPFRAQNKLLAVLAPMHRQMIKH